MYVWRKFQENDKGAILIDKNYENVKAFDGIRGVAFLLVLFIHSIAVNIESSGVYLQGTAKYGVWLFFVLSAFLLTKNYVIPNRSKFEFIVGRFFRIVPLYLIACFFYHVAGVFLIPPEGIYKIALVFYAPAHLWTVPVEFYFYFFLAVLWLIIKKPSNRDYVFIAISVLSLAALAFLNKADNSVNFLWFLPSFLVGYLLARAWPNLRPPNGIEVIVGVILITIALILLSPGGRLKFFGIAPSSYLMNWYFPVSVIWAAFIYLVGKGDGGVFCRAVSCSPVVFCGRVSYSGYLFHWLVIEKVKLLHLSSLLSIMISIIASLLIAYVGYSIFEKPLASWKAGFLHKVGRA